MAKSKKKTKSGSGPAKQKPKGATRPSAKKSAIKTALQYIPWHTIPLEDLNPLLQRQFVVGQEINLINTTSAANSGQFVITAVSASGTAISFANASVTQGFLRSVSSRSLYSCQLHTPRRSLRRSLAQLPIRAAQQLPTRP